MNFGQILAGVIRGQVTEKNFRAFLKAQIDQVSSVLINTFNSNSTDVQITNGMKNILFRAN
jgi:hypothetical protein